jgi:acyl carrier protein
MPLDLDLDQPLDTVGLDSLMAIELKNSLESKLGVNLSIASLLQGPTISSLAREMLGELDSPEAANEAPLVIAQESVRRESAFVWAAGALVPASTFA